MQQFKDRHQNNYIYTFIPKVHLSVRYVRPVQLQAITLVPRSVSYAVRDRLQAKKVSNEHLQCFFRDH